MLDRDFEPLNQVNEYSSSDERIQVTRVSRLEGMKLRVRQLKKYLEEEDDFLENFRDYLYIQSI